MKFVYGDRQRIFINTTLGCHAECKYCYLPDIQTDSEILSTTSEAVINLLKSDSCFVKGENGTVISIGCYSECMDRDNEPKTKEILEYLMPLGNYIQLATKQNLSDAIINTIIRKRSFEQQVSVYISLPTISQIPNLEKGTASFTARIENIRKCINNSIPVALYIKPFLEQITVQDKEIYFKILRNYGIPVVIGNYLSIKNSMSKADVGEACLYEQKESEQYEKFFSYCKKDFQSYRHSVELIDCFRKMREDINGRGYY